jgi:hypothetical protein
MAASLGVSHPEQQSSCVGYSLDSNNVSTETEESPFL